jgi:hypothetical protein
MKTTMDITVYHAISYGRSTVYLHLPFLPLIPLLVMLMLMWTLPKLAYELEPFDVESPDNEPLKEELAPRILTASAQNGFENEGVQHNEQA